MFGHSAEWLKNYSQQKVKRLAYQDFEHFVGNFALIVSYSLQEETDEILLAL